VRRCTGETPGRTERLLASRRAAAEREQTESLIDGLMSVEREEEEEALSRHVARHGGHIQLSAARLLGRTDFT